MAVILMASWCKDVGSWWWCGHSGGFGGSDGRDGGGISFLPWSLYVKERSLLSLRHEKIAREIINENEKIVFTRDPMGGILCLCGENTDKLLEREKRFPMFMPEKE